LKALSKQDNFSHSPGESLDKVHSLDKEYGLNRFNRKQQNLLVPDPKIAEAINGNGGQLLTRSL